MASMSDSGIDIRLQPSYVERSSEKNQTNIGLHCELKAWKDLECHPDTKMKRTVKAKTAPKN